ncbi:MAG: aldo/keto reductase, partial [Spirochaetaceae bacterium]|nr:aldo/keto reductase [Spirochaetaceae bacterium]
GLSVTDIRNLIYGSLKRLKRDRIDLMQIHWPAAGLDETRRALDVFTELKRNSVVRNIGVCNFGVFDIVETADYPIISNQLPYGLLWRVIEKEIAPACKANGQRILSYATLQQGLLSGKHRSLESFPEGRKRTRHFLTPDGSLYRLTDSTLRDLHTFAADCCTSLAKIALAFSLSREFINTVIIGARTQEQLQQILEAQKLQLSGEDLKNLESITEPLKSKLGGNPDMFKDESRVRYNNENGDPVR